MLQSVIPLLFLLSLPWLDRRKVLLLWPLTHLADLDYLFGFHRATLHNVFIVIPFVALAIAAWRRGERGRAEWMLIGAVYTASHIVMDIFAGGVTLLYPLSLHTTCIDAGIRVVTATNTPYFHWERCSFTGVPVVAEVYTWLPWYEVAILAFLVPASLAALAWGFWRRRDRGA